MVFINWLVIAWVCSLICVSLQVLFLLLIEIRMTVRNRGFIYKTSCSYTVIILCIFVLLCMSFILTSLAKMLSNHSLLCLFLISYIFDSPVLFCWCFILFPVLLKTSLLICQPSTLICITKVIEQKSAWSR